MKLREKSKSFGGFVEFYEHASKVTATPMRFSVYRPPQAEKGKVPAVYWLSGLTCTEENFTIKSGAQRFASELGLMVIAPDTSPRGAGIPGEGDSWDFGLGAGFYLNATQSPWSKHYRMYDYVTQELRELVNQEFPVDANRVGIFGHSMGGHGAIVIGLRNPELYRSISAFAPISSPTRCDWGRNALKRYLGPDETTWEQYDSSLLMTRVQKKIPLLVDQGTEDKFMNIDLKPEFLEEAARKVNYPLTLRYQKGYDHSYYFVSSFIGDHLKYHAEILR